INLSSLSAPATSSADFTSPTRRSTFPRSSIDISAGGTASSFFLLPLPLAGEGRGEGGAGAFWPPFASSLAQLSFNPTVRFQIGLPAVLSGSRQKYPTRSNWTRVPCLVSVPT